MALAALVPLAALVLVALGSGGHATAGNLSGLRGLGYTLQERPTTVPLHGASLLQSITIELQRLTSYIGPVMFQAFASDVSSGVK